jgi:hypothetical protein
MTHMRYWTLSLAVAVGGGFIAIERFAFNTTAAVWIAFGVAIAATVCALGAYVLALLRENHTFSGISGLSMLIAAWTIIAMLVFNKPTAGWLAFADGVALLLLSLRALALHETTIERVVYALDRGSNGTATSRAGGGTATITAARPSLRGHLTHPPMSVWMSWLSNVGLAIGGAFIVLVAFALAHYEARWIAFGIAIAALCVSLGTGLLCVFASGAVSQRGTGVIGRLSALASSGASAAVSIGLIVTMAVYSGDTARWIAFALGCGLVGIALVAFTFHELTSERVRHELEVGESVGVPSRAAA